MTKEKRSKDKRLFVGKEMPPLYRTLPGQEYSYKKDEVLHWIAQRPGLLNYVFDKLNFGGYIEYNPETRKWTGVNYDPDES